MVREVNTSLFYIFYGYLTEIYDTLWEIFILAFCEKHCVCLCVIILKKYGFVSGNISRANIFLRIAIMLNNNCTKVNENQHAL